MRKMIRKIIDFFTFKKYMDKLEEIRKAVIEEVNSNGN